MAQEINENSKLAQLITEGYEYLRIFNNDFLSPISEYLRNNYTKHYIHALYNKPINYISIIHDNFTNFFIMAREAMNNEMFIEFEVLINKAKDILTNHNIRMECAIDPEVIKNIKTERISLEGLRFVSNMICESVSKQTITLYDEFIDDAFKNEPKYVRLWNRMNLEKECKMYSYKSNTWFYLHNPVNSKWYISTKDDFSGVMVANNQPVFVRKHLLVYNEKHNATFISSITNKLHSPGHWINGVITFGQNFSYYIENVLRTIYIAHNDDLDFRPILNTKYNSDSARTYITEEYRYMDVDYVLLDFGDGELYISNSKVPSIVIKVDKIPIYNKEAYMLYNGLEFTMNDID